MAASDAIIADSFALQFLDRVSWKKSGLDLYVEEGANLDAMRRHLEVSEKYKLQSQSGYIDPDWEFGITEVSIVTRAIPMPCYQYSY